MIRSSFIFVLFFSLTNSIFSQSEKQFVNAGDRSFENGDYLGAIKLYKQAFNLNANQSAIYAYKYAESLRKYNDYVAAEKYYTKAFELDEGAEFPLSLFWIADMLKYQGNYKEAKEKYELFYKQFKSAGSFYIRKAKNEIRACDLAQKIVLDTLKVVVSNLGNSINTENSEFSASLTPDSMLLFSSLRSNTITQGAEVEDDNYKIKLYESNKSSAGWEKSKDFNPVINNSAYHNANISISEDGKRSYFSRCDDKVGCKIYMSIKKNNEWQNPEVLADPINKLESNSTQPFIVKDKTGELLFFVSDRVGGKGKNDIYYSKVSNNGKKYSNPRNAGRRINTPDNDVTPFYDPEEQCLYFSSNWHLGIGGYDIFKSCGRLMSLPLPQNMGVPYNSSANDLYFTKYNEKGFLTSNRKGSISNQGETCCNDLYEYELTKDSVVQPTIDLLKKFLPVTLYFHNDEPNPRTTDTLTQLSYLTTYDAYSNMIDTYMQKYSEGVNNADDKVLAQEEIEDFFTGYVDKGLSDLRLFSKMLLEAVSDEGNFTITVKGYASPLANTDYNKNLTLRRISSLINYLSEYKGGVLKPYINNDFNGSSIRFVKIPFGEVQSDTTVSDNLNDQRNSVYSKKAALERKIEILSIDLNQVDTAFTTEQIETALIDLQVEDVKDLGKLSFGKQVSDSIKVFNPTKTTITVSQSVADCSCTEVTDEEIVIKPNSSAHIPFTFKATKPGVIERKINLNFNKTQLSKIVLVKAKVYRK